MSKSFNLINHTKYWKKGDLRLPAMVSLTLGPHASDGKNRYYITQNLTSECEVDEAIDQVIKNLEMDRKEAKKILKHENERIHSS